MIRNYILFLLFVPVFAFAQPKGQTRRQNIESQKIAFITKELALTSEEAQKFWPIYNQFESEQKDIRKKRRELTKNHTRIDEMSDAELQKTMENILLSKQKELDLEKTYHAKFLSVLPVKKVAKLHEAEEKFKRFLLKKLAENKAKGKPSPPIENELED